MLDLRVIVGAIALYLAILTAVGWRAERAQRRPAPRWRAVRYGLSLATLCSAWTYFGAVGDASRGSWLFVANALGPVLAITVFAPVWRRIAVLAKQENVGSLADFLAARYGNSRALGVLVTLVATAGALPYIALQLDVLGRTLAFVTQRPGDGAEGALVLIGVLGAMAMVFGARRPSLTQHSRGFVSLIALETLVKLTGLVATAALCLWLVAHGTVHSARALPLVPPLGRASLANFATLTFLCTVTAFTLPRQFHLGFVALEAVEDIGTAARVVPAYFGLWVIATGAIALSIRAGLGVPGIGAPLQMLAIPLASGHSGVAMLAWLGGLSAGGAMVVVELTAISAMVSNEIVLPLAATYLRQGPAGGQIGGTIVAVRRATIVLIALLAFGYYRGSIGVIGPTELGLTALTAFAQLAPPLIGAITWRRGHTLGALSGIAAGIAVWAVMIAAPAFVDHGGALLAVWPAAEMPGPTRAIGLSLLLNMACYIAFSLAARPRLIDQIQANAFVAGPAPSPQAPRRAVDATLADLRRLLAQFIGEREARRALGEIAATARGGGADDTARASPGTVRAAERVLAGVIGAPSARNVMALALASGQRDAAEIGQILDEAGHAVHFSRELLQTTLESLPQGVCVIDGEALLVAWNSPFLHFLGLPPGEVHIGASLEAMLARATRRETPDAFRSWRQAQTEARAIREELTFDATRSFALAGRPLAGGDYLLTLTDITESKRAEAILTQNQEALEAMVEERTRALTEANRALDIARDRAEQATGAQRRFVAAASHDLVQPMHAARLFIGNALIGLDQPGQRDLLARADQAVESAHRLLQALLKLSRLELGALAPHPEPVDVTALLTGLAAEFEPLATSRRLQLVVLPARVHVRSDRDLLRSILQNLLVNALRYTPAGRVVLAARRRGGGLRIEVRDSGVGIADAALPQAFREFNRLDAGREMAEGAGLGLSIVARIARVLDHPVDVRSHPGRGSVFAVTVPLTDPAPAPPKSALRLADLSGLRVLCIDDDADVLMGTAALIRRWGAEVTACAACAEVPARLAWDAVIADYKLGDGNGLDLLQALKQRSRLRILVTATPGEDWAETLPAEGIALLAKPLPPLALQTLLAQLVINRAPA